MATIQSWQHSPLSEFRCLIVVCSLIRLGHNCGLLSLKLFPSFSFSFEFAFLLYICFLFFLAYSESHLVLGAQGS